MDPCRLWKHLYEARWQIEFVGPDIEFLALLLRFASCLLQQVQVLSPVLPVPKCGEFRDFLIAQHPVHIPAIARAAIDFDGSYAIFRGSLHQAPDAAKTLPESHALIPR